MRNPSFGNDGSLYQRLTSERLTTAACYGSILVDKNALSSSLLLSIVSPSPPCSKVMPLACATDASTCLRTDEIEAIRRWLAAGAPP